VFAGEDYAVASFTDGEDHNDPKATADPEEGPEDVAEAAGSCDEGKEEVS